MRSLLPHPKVSSAAWLTLAAVLCLPAVAGAQIGALVSPGPLSRPHTQFEGIGNCQKCHEPGRQVTASRCLACHKPIAERIAAREGRASQRRRPVRGLPRRTCRARRRAAPVRPVTVRPRRGNRFRARRAAREARARLRQVPPHAVLPHGEARLRVLPQGSAPGLSGRQLPDLPCHQRGVCRRAPCVRPLAGEVPPARGAPHGGVRAVPRQQGFHRPEVRLLRRLPQDAPPGGRFGAACASCHGNDTWKTRGSTTPRRRFR